AASLTADVEAIPRVIEGHLLGVGARWLHRIQAVQGNVPHHRVGGRVDHSDRRSDDGASNLYHPRAWTRLGADPGHQDGAGRRADDAAAGGPPADDILLPAGCSSADDRLPWQREDGARDAIGRGVDHRDVAALYVGDVELGIVGGNRQATWVDADRNLGD